MQAVGVMAVGVHFCGCRVSHGPMADGRARLHMGATDRGQADDVQVHSWKG